MLASGLIEEARALYPVRHLNALNAVGYRELFNFFDGIVSLFSATELIKQNTRHYAKRQMTWFRKDPQIRWFNPEEWKDIPGFIQIKIAEIS
jgi:tRNA dimethylallyltransferase